MHLDQHLIHGVWVQTDIYGDPDEHLGKGGTLMAVERREIALLLYHFESNERFDE